MSRIATPRPVPVSLVCCHCRRFTPCWWIVAKGGYADGSRPMCSRCYHTPSNAYYRHRFTPTTITALTPQMREWPDVDARAAVRAEGEG